MIEFVTLLLGLVAGPQSVEVSVEDDVSEVRLLLDGVPAATDDAPPWRLELDLGSGLRPRLLEAVAYDADGTEQGRATQRLNVASASAEVRIAIERDSAGTASAARLTWESTLGAYPLRVRAWFDDQLLEVADPAHIPLPRHSKNDFHLFQAELEFSSDVIAKAQAILGGRYLDELRSELTAVPVTVRRRAKRARAEDMEGWFRAGGEPARVVAFEKGRLDLVLVRGPGVDQAMEGLEGTLSTSLAAGGVASGAATPGVEGGGMAVGGTAANSATATAVDRLRRIMALEEGSRLRIMAPRARKQAGRTVAMEVFAISPRITPEQGGLYWALRQRVELPGLAPELRLADAVAVAALQAANGHRRRGVLLVLADPVDDASRHSVAEVRDYLESIRVPLTVWRVGPGASAIAAEWGEGEAIEDFRQLQSAARRLSDRLDRQRIIWLEGRHLPTAIVVAEPADVEAVG